MPFDYIVNQTGQYVFEPSEEETKVAIGIMKKFENLLLFPGSTEGMETLYLGCAFDRVAFDDRPYDLTAPGAPAIVVKIEFDELSDGVFTEITSEGLHGLLFRGPESKRLAKALIFGLLWERDRLTTGEVEDVHLRSIQECLMTVREALKTNCKVMLAEG